eukprot:TRINITY_DN2517_c0_g1_i2.p1 TRINITY_DN2517_c0_g1~~TRINITY_DN2517_c0_g1_i2.p1  ORF type:complete len:314 (-),score=87.64 TRINITY_DN2517_c0_g1_i2:16-957(-)
MGDVFAPIKVNYSIGEDLGSGTFSVVKKITHKKTKQDYALKVIDKSKVGTTNQQAMLESEVNILKSVHHENIVNLVDIIDTPSHLLLIMELVTGGELFDKIVEVGYYSEQTASLLVKQLVEAVAYLHERNIVHRDLKPENLLVSGETSIQVADFGLSKMVGTETVLKTACGTPGYVAPEVLKCQGYGPQVDVWSIGIITYVLLCGYPPFWADSTAELFERILSGKFEFYGEAWEVVSHSARDFVEKTLILDPKKRLTAQQCLEHPWVAAMNGASDKFLGKTIEEMKAFNARRKLKGAMMAVAGAQAMIGKLKL